MDQKEMRVFVALPVPQDMRAALIEWSRHRKRELSFQKWVHPSDYHITLKFLGNTAPAVIERLHGDLMRIAVATDPLRFALHHFGTFGESSSPRVLWAAVNGDVEPLRRLQRQVEEACRAYGFEPENRPYRPHITLARRYRGVQPFRPDGLSSESGTPVSDDSVQSVDSMVLYQTHMNREPMYEAIGRFPFAAGSL